jgi:uncharacterized repeat protein (TIGR01451 family)
LSVRFAVLVSCLCLLSGFAGISGAVPAGAHTNLTSTSLPPFSCNPCELSFTIEKRQEIAGSKSGFTTSPLIGAIGQRVDYEIVVTNKSDFPERFSEFTDPHCDAGTLAGGPGTNEVAPEQSTTYTCSHRLTAVGKYTNEATVTGSALVGLPVTQTSNKVVVEVPPPPPAPPVPPPPAAPPAAPAPAPAFTIQKLQQIQGGASGFTTATLPGAIGQTVQYEIVVTNTGKVPLKFSAFTDAHCDPGTIFGGSGDTAVAPGSSTTYTCRHLLTSAGNYVNQASVTGTAQGAAPLTEPSNQVEVEVPTQAVKPCTTTVPAIRGANGPKSGIFTVQVSSGAIKRITFYLDGHKLKTLTAAQAKGGKFTIKVDPRRLSRGVHTLSMKGSTGDPKCGSIASSSFVRPFAAAKRVKFTG